MFDKLKEECGIFGIYSYNDEDNLAVPMCFGLSGLQHRGEESCGIAINNYGLISNYKEMGLVSDVFTRDVLEKLPLGKMAIGHVRYSTTGGDNKDNAQPMFIRHKNGNLAVVHNGNLTNAAELKKKFEDEGAIFSTTSDTEIICHVIVRERLKTHSIEEAVKNTMNILKGSYSLLVMSSRKLIAARDAQGFRPLCIGENDNVFCFSSESCALEIVGSKFVRDVKPGEMVVLENNKIKSYNVLPEQDQASCVFEYIYFARPDSTIDGINVHKFRENAGRCLARQAPVDADLVAGVPDSGVDAALGYSKESGIPYDIVFVKSKYIGRSFIQNSQDKRQSAVNLKLNPLKENVMGKKIVLIDDSIVRGNTLTNIIKTLKDAGAEEVHIRIASPAFRDICYFGTDIDNKENLIANNKTVDEIRDIIGADSLEYLSLENLKDISKDSFVNGICTGCFTSNYPIEVPDTIDKNRFESTPIQFVKKKVR